jgi:hypothetical protein
MEMARPQFSIRTLLLVTMAVGVTLMLWRTAAAIVPTLDNQTRELLIACVGLACIVLMVALAGWWSITR